MTTQYKIYLVNKSVSTQQFWCFLERPQQLVNDPNVFANSSTTLAVRPFDPGTNTFTIPVQYSVGAGASNDPVGLGIRVASTVSHNAELKEMFDAKYETAPPALGPTLKQAEEGTDRLQIAIRTNAFDQAQNEQNGWFSNQSFGIQTEQGYIGMTWSPSPNQTRTLTPTLKFYVAVGFFDFNQLASWNVISNDSAELLVHSSFNSSNEATVTFTSTGTWEVTPGQPVIAAQDHLLHSHFMMAKAHAALVEKG